MLPYAIGTEPSSSRLPLSFLLLHSRQRIFAAGWPDGRVWLMWLLHELCFHRMLAHLRSLFSSLTFLRVSVSVSLSPTAHYFSFSFARSLHVFFLCCSRLSFHLISKKEAHFPFPPFLLFSFSLPFSLSYSFPPSLLFSPSLVSRFASLSIHLLSCPHPSLPSLSHSFLFLLKPTHAHKPTSPSFFTPFFFSFLVLFLLSFLSRLFFYFSALLLLRPALLSSVLVSRRTFLIGGLSPLHLRCCIFDWVPRY